jgi:hypothetical protein
MIKAGCYAVYLTILKAAREEYMTPIHPWTGEVNKKYTLPWQPTFVLDMAPRLFATASIAAQAITMISEELINPWHHQVLSYCFSNSTGYTQFLMGLGAYQKENPSTKLNYSKNIHTSRSTPENEEFYTETGLLIPREALLIGEGSATSIFDGASFAKYRDPTQQLDLVNVNYVVLDTNVSQHATNAEVIDRFVATIKGSMSVSSEILKGIFMKLLESSTQVYQFEPVLENDIVSVRQGSDDSGFLSIRRSTTKRRLDNLVIQPIFISSSKTENIKQRQLWISVHVFQQAQKEGLIKDIIKKVMDSFPNRQTKASLCIPTNTDVIPPPLETYTYGHSDRDVRNSKKIITPGARVFVSRPQPQKQRRVDTDEMDIVMDDDASNTTTMSTESSHPESTAVEGIHYNDLDLINKYTKDADELCKSLEDGLSALSLNDPSLTSTSESSSTTSSSSSAASSSTAPGHTVLREMSETWKASTIEQTQEREFLKSFLNKIKNDLPSKNVDVVLDIDDWAAYQHIMTSHCSQIKIDRITGVLMYEHKQMPITASDCASGKWLPVFSLAPHHVARSLHYNMWTTTSSIGRLWNSVVIQKLVKRPIKKGKDGLHYCDLGVIPNYMMPSIEREIEIQREAKRKEAERKKAKEDAAKQQGTAVTSTGVKRAHNGRIKLKFTTSALSTGGSSSSS